MYRSRLLASSVIAGLLLISQVSLATGIEAVTIRSALHASTDLRAPGSDASSGQPNQAQGEELKAYLSKPEGKGPFPAIVVLHGCGGLSERFKSALTERLVSWGYVTLVIDSFANHPIKNSCGANRPLSRRNLRPFDAMGGLQYLSTLSFVDKNKVGLYGSSQGAWAALYVAQARTIPIFVNPEKLKFKAVAAFYPDCSSYFDAVHVPTQIFIGENDEWNPVARCVTMMERRSGKGAELDLTLYRGAHHGFDWIEFSPPKKINGFHLEFNQEAFDHSLSKHRIFFEQKLKFQD